MVFGTQDKDSPLARKFLYLMAIIIGLVITAAIAFAIWPQPFMRAAFVPREAFAAPPPPRPNVYADPAMWLARPDMTGENPSLWRPRIGDQHPLHPVNAPGAPSIDPNEVYRLAPRTQRGNAAVFFVHPTSYLSRAHWNAPLDDAEANWRAGLFTRGMASIFSDAGDVWVPRYRQAALGAFLTTDVDTANQALLAAYADVAAAYEQFLSEIGPDRPIILAGHSQGSLHLARLLRDRIAGRPEEGRIVAAYIVGWPISITQDLPAMGLPACETADSSNCILGWQSYAEPADTSMVTAVYDATQGFVGGNRAGTRMLCVNPISGALDGTAAASDNRGAVRVTNGLEDGELRADGITVGARCDDAISGGRGFLLIGSPPDVGPYVLPGNNYHVFDYPLFWMNVRADVDRRMANFAARQGRGR
jgi:hypothetical protein